MQPLGLRAQIYRVAKLLLFLMFEKYAERLGGNGESLIWYVLGTQNIILLIGSRP